MSAPGGGGPRLVLDWDGTVIEQDMLVLALARFGDPSVFERPVGTAGSWYDLMAEGVATLRTPLEEVTAWLLARVRVRPGLHELVARYETTVLSGNLVELIRPVLAREGLELDVVANGVDPRPEGWLIRLNAALPCGECRPAGEPCKRSSLPAGPVVYVGDSTTDHCAARAAGRVFARDGLARHLADRRLPFEPFEDFRDVLAALERAP